MPETLKYEKIESDTECGKVLNTLFVNKFRRGYVRVKGAVMPEDFKKFGDRIQQMDIRDDDVFVCSFPKAGANQNLKFLRYRFPCSFTDNFNKSYISYITSYLYWKTIKRCLDSCDFLLNVKKIQEKF